jgi:hypothetical protein
MPETPEMPETPDERAARVGAMAKAWRDRLKLTRPMLSTLTGFSPSSITSFEAGFRRDGKSIDEQAFRRYRLCCAAVDAGLDQQFQWGEPT